MAKTNKKNIVDPFKKPDTTGMTSVAAGQAIMAWKQRCKEADEQEATALLKKDPTFFNKPAKATTPSGQGKQPTTAPKNPTPQTDAHTRIRANKERKQVTAPDSAKIKVLKKENPSKAGSGRALAFDTACKCGTVGAYRKVHGAKMHYLPRWVDQGLIEIVTK